MAAFHTAGRCSLPTATGSKFGRSVTGIYDGCCVPGLLSRGLPVHPVLHSIEKGILGVCSDVAPLLLPEFQAPPKGPWTLRAGSGHPGCQAGQSLISKPLKPPWCKAFVPGLPWLPPPAAKPFLLSGQVQTMDRDQFPTGSS